MRTDAHGTTLPVEVALALLATGELTIEGRLVDASNITLFCTVSGDGMDLECVYKPVRGERPLWDFPDGTLATREVAAYAVSEATGWAVVPPTVLREGPLGTGMVQLWIDVDDTVDLLNLLNSGSSAALRRMAVLDAVLNNADRKGGHLLPTEDGHVYGVDHGVCFATDDKLRTVLWQWAGEPLPEDAVGVLRKLDVELCGSLGADLERLLTRREVVAARRRVARLLRRGAYPEPNGDWPALPWPPF